MSQPSMDADHRTALDLSRQLNSNPRRSSRSVASLPGTIESSVAIRTFRSPGSRVEQLLTPSSRSLASQQNTESLAGGSFALRNPDSFPCLVALNTALDASSSTEVGTGRSNSGSTNNQNLNAHASSASVQRSKKRKAEADDLVLNETEAETSGVERSSLNDTDNKRPQRKIAAKKKVAQVKYHQSMQEDKKIPYGEPPVWADKRQSLCEALPYYKAYQSAAYTHGKFVLGFMCDKEVGPRDKFDEEIMIARVGGGKTYDEQTGQMLQTVDQFSSLVALAFERSKGRGTAIAVIAAQSNKISPSKLPHYYNVLDWFHVTDVWCEKTNGLRCWMVRLEKVLLGTKSWWAPFDSLPLDPYRNINAIKTMMKSCSLCGVSSKEIYNAGWTCLQTSCRGFFDFQKEIDEDTLDYNSEFLQERTAFAGLALPQLVPDLITDNEGPNVNRFGFEARFKDGIVCPLCKGCSRRIHWEKWVCETPGCGFEHTVPQKIMRVVDAVAGRQIVPRTDFYDGPSGVRFRQKTFGLYDVYEYIIPGLGDGEVAGVISHYKANGFVNKQPGGPNDLFKNMQETDLGLKRHAVRQKGSTGEILTSHWATNWGAPYKFGVSVESKAFDGAPDFIIKALKRLSWAGEQTVNHDLESFQPFNELLSLGYFQSTDIGYHDDGEKELGPTVATLSLGSDATMFLRPKPKCSLGRSSTNARKTKKDVLKMILRHGDLLVMHGTGIQKLYDHAVMPNGKLRFALTCRHVRPDRIEDLRERRNAEIMSKLPDGHEAYTYDGTAYYRLFDIDESSETLENIQRAMNDFAARVHVGEFSPDTIRTYRDFLTQLIEGVALPATRVITPPPDE